MTRKKSLWALACANDIEILFQADLKEGTAEILNIPAFKGDGCKPGKVSSFRLGDRIGSYGPDSEFCVNQCCISFSVDPESKKIIPGKAKLFVGLPTLPDPILCRYKSTGADTYELFGSSGEFMKLKIPGDEAKILNIANIPFQGCRIGQAMIF